MVHRSAMDTFTTILVIALVAVIAAAAGAGVAIGAIHRGRKSVAEAPASQATASESAAVRDSLEAVSERLRQLEAGRVEWHAQLREQVESVRRSSTELQRETSSLSTALRRPQVRGQWGEMHLRRAVELAGMTEHCDFDLQVSVNGDGNTLRPDMAVRLSGERTVIVDAKAPLEAYLDAIEHPETADEHMRRHAEQVRSHIDALSAKAYWRQFERSPEFVVLFMPSESILSAALESQPALLEQAAAKKVVLATPTTLIALLRTVSYAWTQAELADNARKILSEASELYERIGRFANHLDRVGKALGSAVSSYNDAVGSLESRLLVTARRVNEMGVGEQHISSPQHVDTATRTLTASELTDHLS